MVLVDKLVQIADKEEIAECDRLQISAIRRYFSPFPVTRSVQRKSESDSGCRFLFRFLCFFGFLLLTFCHDALLALMFA